MSDIAVLAPPGAEPDDNLWQRRCRITAVSQVYFHQPNGQPTGADMRWGRWLNTADEQAWVRRMAIGEEWAAVDAGWNADALSLLTVENEFTRFQVMPTPDERQAADLKWVELSLRGDGVADLILRPGEGVFLPLAPGRAVRLQARCQVGQTKIVVRSFPA